jgi:hypothetical protein
MKNTLRHHLTADRRLIKEAFKKSISEKVNTLKCFTPLTGEKLCIEMLWTKKTE